MYKTHIHAWKLYIYIPIDYTNAIQHTHRRKFKMLCYSLLSLTTHKGGKSKKHVFLKIKYFYQN